MKDRIYLDNAATTKMSDAAIEAMMPYMKGIYGNPSSLHSHGQEAAEALHEARSRIAACLGCEPREIYFTSGGSESDNQGILSAARLGQRKGRICSLINDIHKARRSSDRRACFIQKGTAIRTA